MNMLEPLRTLFILSFIVWDAEIYENLIYYNYFISIIPQYQTVNGLSFKS